jgi:hypothetical protein
MDGVSSRYASQSPGATGDRWKQMSNGSVWSRWALPYMRIYNRMYPGDIGTWSQVELLLLALASISSGVESFYNSVKSCDEFQFLSATQLNLFNKICHICSLTAICFLFHFRSRSFERWEKWIGPRRQLLPGLCQVRRPSPFLSTSPSHSCT